MCIIIYVLCLLGDVLYNNCESYCAYVQLSENRRAFCVKNNWLPDDEYFSPDIQERRYNNFSYNIASLTEDFNNSESNIKLVDTKGKGTKCHEVGTRLAKNCVLK